MSRRPLLRVTTVKRRQRLDRSASDAQCGVSLKSNGPDYRMLASNRSFPLLPVIAAICMPAMGQTCSLAASIGNDRFALKTDRRCRLSDAFLAPFPVVRSGEAVRAIRGSVRSDGRRSKPPLDGL